MRDINIPKLVPRPQPVEVFPTMGSLKDAVQYAQLKLPNCNWNDLHNVLLVYHNTLLAELKKLSATNNPTEYD